MALFRKKDRRKDLERAARREREKKLREIEDILKRKKLRMPKREKLELRPKEYREFMEEVKDEPRSLYEKACRLSERILPLKPSKKMSRALQTDIDNSYLRITPSGAISFSILVFVLMIIATSVSAFFNLGMFTMFLLIGSAVLLYYYYNYPASRARVTTLRMSADTVLAVLYMVTYMRTSPNLEGALKFAAENLKGPLSWDLKKLMWDIQVGVYRSADEAVASYVLRWKDRNPEFAEALNLLRGTSVSPARREKLYNEIVNVILAGTTERTKRYVSGLRMPVLLIHAMGVLLPIMGLVLFPIVVIFMADVVKPAFLFIGYDVLLPAFLWILIDHILKARPPTFSQADISLAKGIPPIGKMAWGKRLVPIWPFALALFIPFLAATLYFASPCMGALSEIPADCAGQGSFFYVNTSLLLIIGIAVSVALYALLDSMQKMKVRRDIEKVENEFSVALFQLGNQISGGKPIEAALDASIDSLKGLRISDMFRKVSTNMRKFGYTFEQALFDTKSGAVWYYPSRIIRSMMATIVQSSKKGSRATAESMLTVSRYLKGLHKVKEEVNEILGETISSMRFLAIFLTPLVAGVTITMAIVILQILSTLGAQISTIVGGGGSELTTLQTGFLTGPGLMGGTFPIGPIEFQLIVGIYMIETVLLLSMFINRIEYGDDAIGLRATVGQIILIATFIYVLSWLVTFGLFGNSISSLLMPIT